MRRAMQSTDWQGLSKTVIYSLTLASFFAATCFAAPREWKSTNGKFTIKAEFVAVKEGKVVLEKEDGSYLSVPLDKLCDEDRAFIESKSDGNPFGNPQLGDT